MVTCLVHSHHLLDHKPDNLLIKGHKFNLRGIACLGRPGVALCVGDAVDIANYVSMLESNMPQKKFHMIEIQDEDMGGIKSFEACSLGDLRTLLAQHGHEEHFFAVTGLDPAAATSSSNESKKGKKNKKR